MLSARIPLGLTSAFVLKVILVMARNARILTSARLVPTHA